MMFVSFREGNPFHIPPGIGSMAGNTKCIQFRGAMFVGLEGFFLI